MAEMTAGGRVDRSLAGRDVLLATKLHMPRSRPGLVASPDWWTNSMRGLAGLRDGAGGGTRGLRQFGSAVGVGARPGPTPGRPWPGCLLTRETTTRSGSGGHVLAALDTCARAWLARR
jgi:hypothetical protein